MFVSQGLVDPKVSHNLSWSNGKQVNIPVHEELHFFLMVTFLVDF